MNRLSKKLSSLMLACLLSGNAGAQNALPGANVCAVDIANRTYLLDTGANLLSLFSPEGKLVRSVGGQGWTNEQFDRPSGLWARNGIDVFVADYGNHRIQRFDRNLNYISTFFTRDSDNPDVRFGYPTDVTLSSAGNLYICDTENNRIVKVNSLNQVERTFGGFDAGAGRLHHPTRLTCGESDVLYVLDGDRIMDYDQFGNFLGEFLPGLFRHPVALFADVDGLLVLERDSVMTFDTGGRPLKIIDLGGLPQFSDDRQATSLAAQGGILYIATSAGIVSLPDPRRDAGGNPH